MTPASFRTTESEEKYQKAKTTGGLRSLSEIPSQIEYKLWRVSMNDFPGDAWFKTHDMLIPKRVFANEDDMTIAELTELREIKKDLQNQYSLYYENTPGTRSVLYHYHVHAVLFKEREDGV